LKTPRTCNILYAAGSWHTTDSKWW